MSSQQFFQDNTDPTKKFSIDPSNIATGNTRTMTVPNVDLDMRPLQSQTLTSSTNIAWDWTLGAAAKVTLGVNTTLTITNPVAGIVGRLRLTQDATGGRTVTLAYAGGIVSLGTINTTANASTYLDVWYDGTNVITFVQTVASGGGAVSDGTYGDITVSGTGTVFTIAASAVTNAKMANMNANTFKANNTGSAAAPTDITTTQAKTLLAYTASEVANVAAGTVSATTVQAAIDELDTEKLSVSLTGGSIFVGSLTGTATPRALSGDATLTNTGVITIANSAVSNAKMANMAANTFKANNTGSAAAPTDITTTQAKTLLAYTASEVANVAAGNIAATTVQAAINELDSEKLTTTLTSGNLFVGNGSNVATSVTMSGDATLSNTGALTIAASAVTNAKMANMAANTIKSNATGASAAPSDLTIAAGNFVGRTSVGNLASITAAQARLMLRLAEFPLTFSATQNWDLVNGLYQSVTATANFTLNVPSNAVAGETAFIYVTQDGTGSRTITFASGYKFAGGTAVTLSTAAGAVDRIELFFRSATVIDVSISKAWA